MLDNTPMLTFEDVSQDATARTRSGLPHALFDALGALGFDIVGWSAARPTAVAGPTGSRMLTAVHASRDGRALGTLTRVGDLQDITFSTLFEDGTIVQTGKKPSSQWWYLRWGLDVPSRHDYALSYVDADIPELYALHEARVATEELCGRKVVASHGLRTHFAIRKRYRQFSDPRMRRQEAIAKAIGACASLASMVGIGVALGRHGSQGGLAAVAGLVGLAASFFVGFGAFIGALYFVAPILARSAKAPARRPASELLLLVDDVPMAWLPPEDAKAPSDAPLPVPLSVDELARLKRKDLVLSLALACAFPLVGLAAVGTVGGAGVWVAIAATNLAGALVLLATKKSTVELARERFVPAIAAAERASCTTGVCGIPARWRPLLGLGMGLLSAFVAYKRIAAGIQRAPAWLFLELLVITAVLLATNASRVKKRHQRLVAVTA